MVRLAGAEPVIVETTEQSAWKITAEQFENAMTPKTKMIIINSPGNPTGSVYTREELRAISEVAAEEEIYISRTRSTKDSPTKAQSMSASPRSRRRRMI